MTKPLSPEEKAARAAARQQQQKPPAPAQTTIAQASNQPRARDVVTVGCKMPNGLVLRLHKQETHAVPVLGGGTRDEVRNVPTGEQVTLFGTAAPFGQQPKCLIAGGYALTPNVNKAFMREWMQQNANSDLVKQNLIFVQDDVHAAQDQGDEQAALRHGLEPLHQDPRKDPRTPRSQHKNVTGLEREDTPTNARAA